MRNPFVALNEGLMNRAGDSVAGYRKGADEAKAAAAKAIADELQRREASSIADEIASRGGLMDQLKNSRRTLSQEDVAIRDMLEAQGYGNMGAAEQQKVLEYMAARQMANRFMPGPQEVMNSGMANLAELLAADTLAGKAARLGTFSAGGLGATAGVTAGAQGIMNLIAYLQGEGDQAQY